MDMPLGGLSRSLGRRRTDLQCTSRLTQGRYQASATSCCTGENIPPLSLFFPRSGDDWLIGEKGGRARLKASVAGEPSQPPLTGWKFHNWHTEGYTSDKTVTCRVYINSPPCCLKVSLSGAAKEVQGKCEGEYRSTGLVSMGRPVIII